jgi:hypothetical protein
MDLVDKITLLLGDPNLVVGILALLVLIYHAYHMRRHTIILEAQNQPRAARRRGDLPKVSWWKLPTLPALMILVALAWTPWIYGFFFVPKEDHIANVWHGVDILPSGKPTLSVGGDMTEIAAKYGKRYRILAAAIKYDGTVDVLDAEGLQKSAAHDIRPGPDVFRIEPDGKFIEQLNKGMTITIIC